MSSYGAFIKTPPPGGDQNRGDALLIVIGISLTLVVVTLLLRMYARLIIVRLTGWDDYTIIASTALAIVNVAFNLKYVAVGGGRHSFYLGHQQATEATKWSTVAQLPYILTSCLTKVSICLMIIRLTNSRRMTQAMWTFVGFLVVINLACFIVVTASCRPFQALWDFSIHGKCRSHTILFAFAWIQGGFSIATDLLCTILPILVLWNVKITFRQKIAICGVMSLGLFTTVCCIAKNVLYTNIKTFTDSTYTLTILQIFTVLEQNIGIVATNMPTLRPVYKLAVKKSRGTYNQVKGLLVSITRGRHRQSTTNINSLTTSSKEKVYLQQQQFSVTKTGDFVGKVLGNQLERKTPWEA